MQGSSSQRQRSSTKKTAGCMSGILHLLTRHHHHSRSRKRLPSATKKRDKAAVSPAKPSQPSEQPPPQAAEEKELTIPATPRQQRSSCDAPRSPTLPAELRRAGPPGSPDSPRRPSALVARLMGLDEAPVDSPRSSTSEKRRKLLGALEKCDEDLRALKRIIEAVQTAEVHKRAATAAAAVVVSHTTGVRQLDGGDSMIEAMAIKCMEANGDQPSPVSVLDALASPRYRPHRYSENGVNLDAAIQSGTLNIAVRSGIMQRRGERHRMARGIDDNRSFFHRISIGGLPSVDEPLRDLKLARWMMRGSTRRWRLQRSRAMAESIEEVWEDGLWEERWEFGRVGVVLEGEIYGDLVEEVVVEMLACCYKLLLSLGTCRKRLYF